MSLPAMFGGEVIVVVLSAGLQGLGSTAPYGAAAHVFAVGLAGACHLYQPGRGWSAALAVFASNFGRRWSVLLFGRLKSGEEWSVSVRIVARPFTSPRSSSNPPALRSGELR